MAQITKEGREIALKLLEVTDTEWEQWQQVKETLSLMLRHSKTYRRVIEMQCGDGIHSGEWVNANWEQIESRREQLEARLASLVDSLPLSHGEKITAQIGGDPRGWIMRLEVPNRYGNTVTVGIW